MVVTLALTSSSSVATRQSSRNLGSALAAPSVSDVREMDYDTGVCGGDAGGGD